MTVTAASAPTNTAPWLQRYYAVRALFSAAWVAIAFTLGASRPEISALLLIAYPLWDCAANFVDGQRNGGLRSNPTQLLNVLVSALVATVVLAVVGRGAHSVIVVIGVWAALSGLLQLSTAVRRWRSARAQWPMILSGAQSTLAGVHFVLRASDSTTHLSAATVAPYAAFGALYFAISAVLLTFRPR